MWVSNDWYILICGLEGDEVLLEPPEHSPFLHQPPDYHKVDDYDGVNDASDNDGGWFTQVGQFPSRSHPRRCPWQNTQD